MPRPHLFSLFWRHGMPAALFMLVAWLIAAPAAMAEPRVALVIGNGKYGKEIGSLVNPPNDANLMADSLAKLGFKVTKVVNGDQKTMKRAISSFGQQLVAAGPDAVGLFFYAGHGIAVDGVNYLIPVGAAIQAEADVDLEAVSADTVLKQMQYSGARVNIIILDACRNNPLPRSMRSASRGLERMDAPAGSFVGYSTAPGQVASDGDGKNSPYTTALVTELAKPGIAIEEAFRNVRVDVMAKTGSEQVPWDSSSLTGAFFFQPGAKAAISVDDGAEKMLWDEVKTSQDPSDIEVYLAKYPQGAYAGLANQKISKLRTTPPKLAERSSEAPAAKKAPEPEPVAATPAPVATASETTSQVASLAPVVNSDPNGPIQISAKVSGMIKGYLAELQHRNGAFAVSPDGTVAATFICMETMLCVPGKKGIPENMDSRYPQKRALQKCKGASKQECVILYARDNEKHPFTVAEQ